MRIFIAVFIICLFKLSSFDIFWHLKTGEYIVQTGSILNHNLFSWTYPDYPWVPTYWLFEIIVYGVYSLAGFSGLVFFNALILAGCYGSLARYFQKRGIPVLPVTIVFLAVIDLSFFRFMLRPHIFTLLGLSMLIQSGQLLDSKNRIKFILIPFLFTVWVNLHSGVVFGLAYICIIALENIFTAVVKKENILKTFLKETGFLCLCIAATLINPNNYRYLLYIFDHLDLDSIIRIEEFGRFSPGLYPKQALILFLLVFPSFLAGRIRIRPVLLLLLSFYLLSKGVRFIPEACLFLIPFILMSLKDLKIFSYSWQKNSLLNFILPLLYALHLHVNVYTLKESYYESGLGIHGPSFPAEACGRLQPGKDTRLYNSFSTGGYVIFRFDKLAGVFQDGRIHAYPTEFFRKTEAARQDIALLEAMFEEYKINTVLLNISEASEAELALLRSPGWRIVYEDCHFILGKRS